MTRKASSKLPLTSLIPLAFLLILVPLLIFMVTQRVLYKSGAAYFAPLITPTPIPGPYSWYAPDGTKCDNSNSSTAQMTYYSQPNCQGTTYYHAAGTACSTSGQGTCYQIKPQFHVVYSYKSTVDSKCTAFGPTNLSETNTVVSLCAWRTPPPTPTPTPPLGYLRIISPNGGETYYVGKKYHITWTSSGITSPVSIRLTNEITGYNLLINPTAPNTGDYLWQIPFVPLASTYKIYMDDTPPVVYSDVSDNYFKIQNLPTPTPQPPSPPPPTPGP